MDDISIQINFTGRSGKNYSFVHCYDLAKDTVPGSEGVYVFAKLQTIETGSVIDIQLLQSKDEINDTVDRMKEDGAAFAFFKEYGDELAGDTDIDDIKGGEDYRKAIE